MPEKPEKFPQDDVDRLKRAAFWYWEYMRRNPLYRRYCQAIKKYDDYFKSLGVYDFMQSKEYLDEMSEYVSCHDESNDLEYTPFRRRFEHDHGQESGRIFYKYGFLSNGFEKHFGRIYKCCSEGLDSDFALRELINGNCVDFYTENIADISALIKLNGQWLITVDDETPSTFSFDMERKKEIKIEPNSIITNPDKVGLEVFALKLINIAVDGLFKKQRVSLDTYESVYKLSLAGKHINSSDAMRLCMLWLWDKAHEQDEKNPAPFNDVYSLLKAKIEKANVSDGVWEQILYRKPRIREYYEATDRSIQQRIVIPLKSK